MPADAVDRSPRPWRIDPYRRATDSPTANSRLYQAARKFAEKLKGGRRRADRLVVRTSLIAELRTGQSARHGGRGHAGGAEMA